MADYVRVVRGLLEGRTVEYREGGRAHPIRFLHPEGRWIDIGRPVEVWVSAFGPKGRRLAGAIADGVLIRWEGEEATERARAEVCAGAEAAGRDPDAIKLGVVTAVYPVEDESELETPEARAALGPLVVSRLRYLTAVHGRPEEVPEPFRPGFAEYQAYRAGLDLETRHLENYLGYLVFTPEHLERFVTPASMQTIAHIADPAGVAAELRRIRDAGVDQATLQIAGPPRRWCERMGAEVLPALR
jgi:alkanesulfonate monooxygenase SsuD/methylene tetrahydromethanopterin reductase-like flavin-dependent oxidoreductase (luciferase family)